MFGLGMLEILMILAIALIVVGPKKLPELAKTLGKAMGEFKRSAQELKRTMDLESSLNEADTTDTIIPETNIVKEANLDDLPTSDESVSDTETDDPIENTYKSASEQSSSDAKDN